MPRLSYCDDSVRKPRERAPPVTLDWIDGKNVKLLRVANHREAFRFQKLNQALSSMESLHKNCWQREERRVRQNLKRLANLSPTYQSQTLFQRQNNGSVKAGAGGGRGVHLPRLASQDTREAFIPRSLNTPALRSAQSTAAPSPRPSHRGLTLPMRLGGETLTPHSLGSRNSLLSETPSSTWGGRNRGVSLRLSQLPSSLSLTLEGTRTPLLPTPSLMALLPAQLCPELHGLQEAVLGFPLLQRRVRELIARAAEREKQAHRNLTLQPLEALCCRYLRLSESNITTLLQLCRDSGIHVDIHPHMKDSDIDISTLFKSSSSPSPSSDVV